MRLYLSSFRLGDHPERLLAMLRLPARAAVIANSCDAYTPEDPAAVARRELAARSEIAALTGLGLEAEELDLRRYFGQPDRLAADLAGYALVWLRGGNTFVLRHALAESGADSHLTHLLRDDALVYGGYSAGACVLAPSLHGLELIDDPDAAVQRAYGAVPRWDGLGVLDGAIVPHYRSPGHPETESCDRLAEHYEAQGIAHTRLRDGQAMVIHGDQTEIV